MKIKKIAFIKLILVYFLVLFLVSYTAYSGSVKPRMIRDAPDYPLKAKEIKESQTVKPEVISGKPVLVAIPRLGVKAAIVDGNYASDTQKWNVSPSHAHFATVTSLPNNQAGNTLIYGHNSADLFSKTNQLVEEDKLYIWTENDWLFGYEFVSGEEVRPENTQVFNYEGEPRVTLITCTGFLNEKRRMMTFNFQSVSQTTQ